MTERLCEARVCVVTGAGRGLGRDYALMLAAHGAKVVVNDLGGDAEGQGADAGPAHNVVDEIRTAGGEAVANTNDISRWQGAEALIGQAVDTFGALHVLINNAGILRDRTLVSLSEAEWDAVIGVHLKGTAGPSHFAAQYWRREAKAGRLNDARLINTTSVAGLYANPGQTNYASAKAGIIAFTQVAAQELERYGVTVNAVAPGALTRLGGDLGLPEKVQQRFGPEWIAAVITWLASPASVGVTGQVIESSGVWLSIAEGWRRGPTITEPPTDPHDVDAVIRTLVEAARPRTTMLEIRDAVMAYGD